jgi:hypothetical protein
VGLALRALESGVIDQTDHFVATSPGDDDDLAVGIQCMRFFNGDMWYSDDELALLQKGLKDTPLERRVCFFSECLRLRRAERLLWEDTPLAKIFTAESEWHLLHMRARVVQVKRKMADKKLQPAQFFERFDADGDGILTHKELVQAFEIDIGFSPADSAEVVKYLDQDKQGRVTRQRFTEVFATQTEKEKEASALSSASKIVADLQLNEVQQRLQKIGIGTDGMEEVDLRRALANAMVDKPEEQENKGSTDADMDELSMQLVHQLAAEGGFDTGGFVPTSGGDELPRPPPGKWMCTVCTMINPLSLFYCEVCNSARPDLMSVKF